MPELEGITGSATEVTTDSGASAGYDPVISGTEGTQGGISQDGQQATEGQQAETRQAQTGTTKSSREYVDKFLKSPDFRALEAEKPDLAKALKVQHHNLITNANLLAPYGGLKELPKIVEAINQAGGLSEIADMQTRLSGFEEADAQLEAGDPGYIERIASEMPEIFAKMIPVAIQKWAAMAPEAFDAFVSNIYANDFEGNNGLIYFAQRAQDFLEDGKPEKALAIIKSVMGWAKSFRAKATARPAQQNGQQAGAQAAKPVASTQSGPTPQFHAALNPQVEAWEKSDFLREASRLGKALNAKDPDEVRDFCASVRTIVIGKIKDNPAFAKPYNRAWKSGDANRAFALLKQFGESHVSEAVKTVYNRRFRGGNIPQQVAKKSATQSGTGTPQQFSAMPELSQSDRRMSLENYAKHGFASVNHMYMAGKAYKNGKLISWQVR